MMAASIQNRSKELAILESIGMTTKQIQKMIIGEGAGYAGISLILAMFTGIPSSYAVFCNLNIYGIPFSIPLFSNLVLVIAIIIICITAPVLILKRLYNGTVIERLRE